MTKTALDLRTEFHQEIEILMRTQAKMKEPVTKVENSGESIVSRMTVA